MLSVLQVLCLGSALFSTGYAESLSQLTFENVDESAIEQNMTVASALDVLHGLRKKDPTTVGLLERTLAGHNEHQKEKLSLLEDMSEIGSVKRHAQNLRRLETSSSPYPTDYGKLGGAMTKLNDLIFEAIINKDEELLRCRIFNERINLEKVTELIAGANQEASAARGDVLRWQGESIKNKKSLPIVKRELSTFKTEYASERSALLIEYTAVSKDVEAMEKVMKMTDCQKQLILMMLKCKHHKTGRHFYAVDHPQVHAAMSLLQSTSAQRIMQEGLAGLSNDPVLAQDTMAYFNKSLPFDVNKVTNKCTVSGSPNCDVLRDKFSQIQGEITDKRDDLKDALHKNSHDLHEGEENYMSQIEQMETLLTDAETNFASSTARQNSAEEESRLRTKQYTEESAALTSEMKTCRENIGAYVMEMCGLRKIRTELLKMSDMPTLVQDCVVSNWADGDCSVSCGGGFLIKNRTITVRPVLGAGCPALSASYPCNEFKCPIDCITNDWSEWSACSAPCGGGVVEKVRSIVRPMEEEGAPCGEVSITEACNMQDCNTKCLLGDWGHWTPCSKACDGGSSERTKRPIEAAKGTGACEEKFDPLRFQEAACNNSPCIPVMAAKDSVLTCHSKYDITLILDGSGSVGSKGWKATIEAASKFAKAMGPEVNLALMVFSGPTSYTYYYACIGVPGFESVNPNLETDCKIKTLSTYSANAPAMSASIEGLEWPKGTTMTAATLAAAEAMMNEGRTDAESIVIMITDGRPGSSRATVEAAESLRKKARLMFVAVTRSQSLLSFLEGIASYPPTENVVPITQFSDLATPENLNAIISDMCPNVTAPVVPVTLGVTF